MTRPELPRNTLARPTSHPPSLTPASAEDSRWQAVTGRDADTGVTPAQFRKAVQLRRGGAGETVRFATAPCSLGVVAVAATDQGICAVELGDTAEQLVTTLRTRFSRAALVRADGEFGTWLDLVVNYLDKPHARYPLAFPLDMRGTAFQHRVWQALQDIPSGQTISYGSLAARLGNPRAVRAVARACASNALAVLIPCHRVVSATGDLTGYRWGLARKAALLAREKQSG